MIKIETSTQREGLEYLYNLARSEQVKWSETDLNERIPTGPPALLSDLR